MLALRPPPPGAVYRQEITTAAQDYALAARRLLRWDLAYLFEALPAEVMLQLKPLEIAVQGEAATMTVAYGFGLDVDTAITRGCQQSGRWIDGRGSLLQCADPGLQRIDRGPDGGEARRIALVAFIAFGAFGRPLRETLELPCDPRSP